MHMKAWRPLTDGIIIVALQVPMLLAVSAPQAAGQTAQQRDRIFIGAWPHRLEAWDKNVERGDRAAAPAQCQMRLAFGALEIQGHFFQQGAQQFLAITVGGSCRAPDLTKISGERREPLKLFGSKCVRSLLFAAAREAGLRPGSISSGSDPRWIP
jgi:hypothetical protein